MDSPGQLWLDALDSGDYKSGKKFLRRKDEYCVWGVACDIFHKNTDIGKWLGNSFVIGTKGNLMYPPQEVLDWLNVNTFALNGKYIVDILCNYNDEEDSELSDMSFIIYNMKDEIFKS